MTTVFCDGNVLIADRRATYVRSGDEYAKDNTDKIFFPKNHVAKVDGGVRRVLAGAAAGSLALIEGFKNLMDNQASLCPEGADLRLSVETFPEVCEFTDTATFLFLLEDGYVCRVRFDSARRNGGTYSRSSLRPFGPVDSEQVHAIGAGIGAGSGLDKFKDVSRFLNSNVEMRENFMFAVTLDENSSRSFSAYHRESDTYARIIKPSSEDYEAAIRKVTHGMVERMITDKRDIPVLSADGDEMIQDEHLYK